jgi:enterochelin esterase-like enzyme
MSVVGSWPIVHGVFVIAAGLVAGAALAQPPLGNAPQPRPEATPAAAPAGFDKRREGMPAGRIERVEFDVYLHGIGGNETHWPSPGAAGTILDNLIAAGKAVPMIVVMPNGRASSVPSTLFTAGRGAGIRDARAMDVEVESYAAFERELLGDLISFIELRYAVTADRMHRALAGLSMGGGQSLNFGLNNVDTFAWVGGFSSAPNTKPPAELVKDPAAARRLALLWVSCGNADALFNISAGVYEYLTAQHVPRVWHVDDGGHTFQVWKNDLYHFASLLFR